VRLEAGRGWEFDWSSENLSAIYIEARYWVSPRPIGP
jgi:hypothetical protein